MKRPSVFPDSFKDDLVKRNLGAAERLLWENKKLFAAQAARENAFEQDKLRIAKAAGYLTADDPEFKKSKAF